MTAQKLQVLILFGGRSAEHEVSLRSARSILSALDPEKYNVSAAAISRQGHWQFDGALEMLKNPEITAVEDIEAKGRVPLPDPEQLASFDAVFPVLHGPYGEDGTVQGMLKLAGIPYVGPDILGSSVAMDKDAAKRLLEHAGIPIAPYIVHRRQDARLSYDRCAEKLGSVMFVKPANLGSSVGVAKVQNASEFDAAVEAALTFDNKIVVEQNISGRELECSVLGNENPQASICGEIVPQRDGFYSYDAKYIDDDGALLIIPAEITPDVLKSIQKAAVQAFETLCCEGMARVDVFLTDDNKVYLNEINTIPGFTSISMYPKLWEASGLGYSDLLDKLIELAVARQERDDKLKVVRN